MKIFCIIFLLLAVSNASGQDTDVTGFRGEVLAELNGMAGRIIQLAEAIPEDLYDWRPAEGVRSVREVLLHLAGGNYGYPALIGYDAPEWYERGKFEREVTGKAEAIDVLRESFEHHRTAIISFTGNDLEESVRWFGGREITRRGALISITRHTGEHLGQLIAYARMNGIVPPWSR